MKEIMTRRHAFSLAIAGAVAPMLLAARTPSSGTQNSDRNSMFPEGHLKVLGFIDQPDREWYETIHAPDFLSFAAPFMARYARNWITGASRGEKPDFTVLTEIEFASEAARTKVRELMATPVARPLLEHTMEQRAKLGISDELPPPGAGALSGHAASRLDASAGSTAGAPGNPAASARGRFADRVRNGDKVVRAWNCRVGRCDFCCHGSCCAGGCPNCG